MTALFAAMFVSLISVFAAANAQNLIVNPSFDNNAASWVLSSQSLWTNENHADDDSASGSVLVQEVVQNPTTDYGSVSQCVEVNGETNFVIETWVEHPRIVARECADSGWNFQVDWWSDPACGHLNGNPVAQIRSSSYQATTDWTSQSFEVTSPPAAKSGNISLISTCSSSTGGNTAFYFDDVSMLDDDVIFAGNFETASSGP